VNGRGVIKAVAPGAATIGLVALLLLVLAAPASANGLITGRVARAGKWLVDAQGRVVIVHGVGIIWKTAPYYPPRFGVQDARFLANEGFTAAREGFIWAGAEPQPGKYNERYIAHNVALNALLARYGIRTLIDFHQDAWSKSAGGDGAPDWATLGTNFEDDFQHFWNNDPASDGVGIQTHFINTWRHVIRKLDASRAKWNILGWDPFNEPYPGTDSACAPFIQPCPQFEEGELPAFYNRWIGVIRRAGDRHVIWPEDMAQNGTTEPNLPAFSDRQTAYNFHYYCSITQNARGSSPQDAGCEPADQNSLGNFTAYANRLHVPAIVSEFSCSDANDENQRMVDLMGEDLLSWTIWAYYTKDPAGCPTEGLLINDDRPGSEANAKQAKLDAIVVPYPQAIAGTPRRYSYDRATDTMTFSYRASAVPGAHLARGALTQIFVPRRHYPHGYHVRVSGARVVSSPTWPWVLLRARRGANVTVTITPTSHSMTLRPLSVCSTASRPPCG
jgi:endoglycosylceramidase